MKILTKIYQQNLGYRTELIKICISEHRTFSSGYIENKVITIVEDGFHFIMGYNKQKKKNRNIK